METQRDHSASPRAWVIAHTELARPASSCRAARRRDRAGKLRARRIVWAEAVNKEQAPNMPRLISFSSPVACISLASVLILLHTHRSLSPSRSHRPTKTCESAVKRLVWKAMAVRCQRAMHKRVCRSNRTPGPINQARTWPQHTNPAVAECATRARQHASASKMRRRVQQERTNNDDDV
jgi:hypothetical protein